MPRLICFSYRNGSDHVEVQAYVEDAIQVVPAFRDEPPQFASAPCKAVLLWDRPIDAENYPTAEQIERMLAWIPHTDWVAIPPITFPEDERQHQPQPLQRRRGDRVH